MRALVWANSVGAGIFAALVPVVWIRPQVADPVIWWCLPAVVGIGGVSVLVSMRHLSHRMGLGPGPGLPRGWLSAGWRQIFVLLEGVPRWGVALGLSCGVAAGLVAAAAAVAQMTGVPGPPDVAVVVFVAVPVFLLAGMALVVAAAIAERDRRKVAGDSS